MTIHLSPRKLKHSVCALRRQRGKYHTTLKLVETTVSRSFFFFVNPHVCLRRGGIGHVRCFRPAAWPVRRPGGRVVGRDDRKWSGDLCTSLNKWTRGPPPLLWRAPRCPVSAPSNTPTRKKACEACPNQHRLPPPASVNIPTSIGQVQGYCTCEIQGGKS